MTPSSHYRSLLRSVFVSILQSGMNANDLQNLVQEFRRGRLTDELAYMLEWTSGHFNDPPATVKASHEVNVAEQLMKERKITKISLINMLRSIDPDLSSIDMENPARTILKEFHLNTTSARWQKLLDTLYVAGGTDPYLKGIGERRRP